MSKNVAVLLAQGFEEAEAIIAINTLRRLEIPVTTLACQNMLELKSQHQIRMFADALLERKSDQLFDAVILPGGWEAVLNLAKNPQVTEFLRRHDEAGRLICPIGAAIQVLAAANLIKGRRYVCTDDLSQDIEEGTYVESNVVEDGNLISAKGPGVAFDFAFTVGWRLNNDSEQTALQLDAIAYSHWRPN